LRTIAPFESGGVVSFKGNERSIEHFPAWHEDDV
jgi:hypothetical protein